HSMYLSSFDRLRDVLALHSVPTRRSSDLKLRGWHVLFPSFTPASEILTELRRRIAERGIEVMTRTEARGFSREGVQLPDGRMLADRKSTRLNSSHVSKSYAVFCLKKKNRF